jgi:predicted SnoaL-like aldol condensation-catalyzing enzyme
MGANDERQREFVERVQGAGELQAVDEFIAPRRSRADFVRHRDGQIVEHWNIVDVAGLLAQMRP